MYGSRQEWENWDDSFVGNAVTVIIKNTVSLHCTNYINVYPLYCN